MKLEVSKKDLLDSIKKVNSIGESKTMSILQTILLVPDPITKILGLAHTTLDLTAYSEIEVEITNSPEKILVESKLFSQIIANQPEIVKMELQDKILKIGKYKINTLNVDEFPKINVPGEALEKIEISKDISVFKNFVDKDPSRYILQHIYFNKGEISATDGKILASYKMGDFESDFFIKPEILNKDTKSIEVYKDFILVESNNLLVRQQKVEGEFPKIEEVIPKYSETVEFDLGKLKNLVVNTIPLVTDYNLVVRFDITKDKIEVSKKSEKGEFKDSMPAKSTVNLTIGFNPFYLLNFLKFIPEGKIYTGVENGKPVVYKDEKSVAVVMPMLLD